LFDIPDFFSDALLSKLEKDVVNVLLSTFLSQEIATLWRSGDAKWAAFTGEGRALKDAATVAYLSLNGLAQKGIVLTVPKDLLDADNLAKFESILKSEGK
jgi:hypothetical protein